MLAVIVSFMGQLGMGVGFGYISPYGEQIDEDIGMSADLNDLLIGDVSFGGLVGCLIAGKLADRIGRKKALSVSFSFTTIGWLFVTLSVITAMIFSGRIIHGIGEGMVTVVTIVYVSEYIQEKYRGGALSSLTVGCLLGLVLTYVVGVFIPWRTAAGIFTVMNLLLLLGSFVIQESPLWLSLKENQRQKDDVEEEKNGNDDKKPNIGSSSKEKECTQSETDVSLTRIISTSLAPVFLLLAPSTGCYSIGFFAISIVEKMHMGNPALVAIAIGMMRIVGAICAGAFIQKFGRRVSLIFSCASTSFSLMMVSLLLLLDNLPPAVFNYSMVTLLILVMFCTSLGITPVPWILLGEWPQVRDKVSIQVYIRSFLLMFQGIVGSVGSSSYNISVFLASMMPGLLEPRLGMAGMFAVFAAITALFLGLVILLVPETAGKSYPEYIAEQAINRTFSFWLPDLKNQPRTVQEIIRKKSY